MRSWHLICVAVGLCLIACHGSRVPNGSIDRGPTTRYVNGRWYDGDGFVARDAFVRAGEFVSPPDEEPEEVVDLGGVFVLPGFAEAHHHMVLCEPGRITQFVDAGILFAGVMNARVTSRACQAEFHGRDSVEVVNALAGLTASEAHPTQIGLYFLEEDEVDGEWVYLIDDAESLERAWSSIQAKPPDLLKVFLSYSEDFARLRGDTTIASWYRGLDPNLVVGIVERAHAMDLRVAAHVMSAHDFEVAVDAGVDVIAHMPGFAPDAAFTDEPEHPYLSTLSSIAGRYRLTPEMARRAAERGVGVMTTVSGAPPTPSVVHNFRLLIEAGVQLLVGSDRGEFHSVDEAVFLAEEALMTSAEVVRSLSVETPRFLFPERSLGDLSVGAEATFVGLRDDPLVDIGNLREPVWVVKDGWVLRGPEVGDRDLLAIPADQAEDVAESS